MLWCKNGSIHDDRLVSRFVLVRIDDTKRLFCMALTKNQCLVYLVSSSRGWPQKARVKV